MRRSTREKRRASDAWAKTRKRHLATFPECRVCEEINPNNHDHLCYSGPRGSSEHSGDLVTLCEHHHYLLHAELGRPGPAVPRQLEWIRIMRQALLSVDVLG